MRADNDAKKTSRSTLAGGQMTAAAIFSKDGRIIYVGQTRGLLSVLDAGSLQFLDVLKVGRLSPTVTESCLCAWQSVCLAGRCSVACSLCLLGSDM